MSISIREITEIFENTPYRELSGRISEYETDDRSGVKKLLDKYRRRISAHEKEDKRLHEMFFLRINTVPTVR